MVKEFLLVSTSQKHGFPAPTRYSVLADQLNDSADKLHLLSYKLCHSYFNIPQATRVPAPLLFALKVAKQVAQRSLVSYGDVTFDFGRHYEPIVIHPVFRSKAPGLYFL